MTDKKSIVLVIDDEQPIRQLLKSWLAAHGYAIQEAETGRDGVEKATAILPDVILLDLGLPDLDGTEVIHQLRRIMLTPIIVLSVRSSASEKIAALDAGADDYLTKPWQPPVLLTRIRIALTRSQARDGEVFAAAGLRVDLGQHLVEVNARHVDLTESEFELMRTMVENAGRLVSQRRLAEATWGRANLEDSLQRLRVVVNGLRQKLEVDPAHPRYIVPEPGVGYRLRIEP